MLKRNYRVSPNVLAAAMMFLFLVSSVLGFSDTPQQDVGHLTGFIYKADGETPLADAYIVLKEIVRGKETGTEYRSEKTTGDTGKYEIRDIPEGKYKGKIMVNDKHYKLKKVDFFVHIKKGETHFLALSLKGRKLP